MEIEIAKILVSSITSGLTTWIFLRLIFEKFVNQQNIKNEGYEKRFEKHEGRMEKIEEQIRDTNEKNQIEFHELTQAIHNLVVRHDNLEKAYYETKTLSEKTYYLLEEVNYQFTQIIKLLTNEKK